MSRVQVRTRQVIAVIMIMANAAMDPEMQELLQTPVSMLYELLGKLSPASPLQQLAPAIASLFTKQNEVDLAELSKLLVHPWMTEEIFGACLNRAMAASTPKCLALLGQAVQHFDDSDHLVICLWNLQVPVLHNCHAMKIFCTHLHENTATPKYEHTRWELGFRWTVSKTLMHWYLFSGFRMCSKLWRNMAACKTPFSPSYIHGLGDLSTMKILPLK